MQKKILYFGDNAISPIQGGGIVVYNIVKDLEPSNLLGFYLFRHITPAKEYADRFNYVGLSKFQTFVNRHKHYPKTFINIASNLLYHFADKDVALALEKVIQKVKEQNFIPEVVYVAPGSYKFLKLAVEAAKYYNLPIIMLNMDNWPEEEAFDFVNHSIGKKWHKRSLDLIKEAGKLCIDATTNSPELSDVMYELAETKHRPANNCCEDLTKNLNVDAENLKVITDNEIPVITYAGAMNKTTQGETLEVLAGVFAELNAEGVKAHLHIYTTWQFAPQANVIQVPNAVYYKGQVSKEELAQIYLDSDFLLTTTTFRHSCIRLFRHSLSTKLSEYLCVGKPVISAGLNVWHLNKYVKQKECGFVIEMDEGYSRSKIKEEIKKILNTPKEELVKIGRRNRELWKEAHDVEVMSLPTKVALGLKPEIINEQ